MFSPRVRAATTAAATLIFLVAPAAGLAQDAGPGQWPDAGATPARPQTEIVLSVGALTPLADMGQTEGGASAGLSTSFAVGGGVTRWTGERWGIAVDGLWATGGPDVRTMSGDGEEPDVPPADGGATYLTGTASVVHRFPAFAGVVEPRLGLGAGIRHVEMDEAAPFGAVSETGPAAVLRAGVRSTLNTRTALTVELRDVISSTSIPGSSSGGALQNDLLVLVGVAFRP